MCPRHPNRVERDGRMAVVQANKKKLMKAWSDTFNKKRAIDVKGEIA